MKKITIVAVTLAIILSFASICFATNTTTGNVPVTNNTTTVNDNTRTSSISNNDTIVTPRTSNVTTTDDGTMIIDDSTENTPVDTVVDDTRDLVDTTVDTAADAMDNSRVWTIIIAILIIAAVIGVCIYYMASPKLNS